MPSPISYIASAVPAGNPTTSYTVVIPASTQADDILVLTNVHKADANGTVTDDDTGGNTWALIGPRIAQGAASTAAWWKRATSGTASKTVTVSGLTG